MASQTIDLLFGVTGQVLYFDAPEGRPSSVTSSTVYENSIGDDGTTEVATTGSAAVETHPNTTFDDDSGPGEADPRVCHLAATTGIVVGRRYRATNAIGEFDDVEVASIVSAASIIARQPLQNAYASGATFVTTRITHALDATWIADQTNLSGAFDPNPRYRWRLVYVVGGVTYVHDLYFDLLRYAGRHDVSPLDVDRRARGWLDRVATEDREDQGRAVIDEAHRIVKFDLYALDMPDQMLRNREVLNELVILKALELVDATEMNEKRYSERITQLVARGRAAVSLDPSGAAAVADVRPFWRK